MRTASLAANFSRRFALCLFLAMTWVATSALVCAHPVFAQTDGDFAPQISTDGQESSALPDLGESWDVGPPALAHPGLAPAPEEPMDPESLPISGGYTPARPVNPYEPWMEPPESRFAQPFVNPSIPATSQMRELTPIGTLHGGFYGPAR